MKQLTISVLAFALLLASAIGTPVQSGPEPQASQGISPEILAKRYQEIWDSVGKPPGLPRMVVHLGASAGNRITVWVKLNDRDAVTEKWELVCTGTNAVSVQEEVHDSQFRVSKLAITRNDGNNENLSCTLSAGKNSASLVVPVLKPSLDQGRFSFLAYSCNEPFSTKDRKGILARDLSLWLRMDARASGENSREQLPVRPQFVLGVGDQIYVDPDSDSDQEPLSFFNGDRSDNFLIDNESDDSLYEALDVVYRYNFSLPPLANAFSKLPSYMMWDDHEIRDGWGSQGDESDEPMKPYFRVARHAFIAHQLLRSYPPGEMDNNEEYKALVDGDKTLHRPFSYGARTHVLMLDSRSTRGRDEIFERTAREAVQDWLSRGRKGQGDLYVLTVGAPLFPSTTGIGTLASWAKPDIKDDLRDRWDSEENEHSQAELLKMLAKHFSGEKNDRLLVISGDVHYSSLYFLSLNGRVVGQEIVTSGIAHSLPSEARSGNWLLDSAQRVGQFEVRPAGKINDSASFAEFSVDPGAPHQPPKVDLVFHLNGTRVKGGVAIGNTNLLSSQPRPLWYHTYQYDYRDPLEHLAAAGRHADPIGDLPAGTIMPLPLSLPPVRTRPSLLLWPFGRNVVKSAIQAQSVFCTVPGTDYNRAVAESWDLTELAGCCMRLKR